MRATNRRYITSLSFFCLVLMNLCGCGNGLDQLNGSRETYTESTQFLFGKGSYKYVPSIALSSDAMGLAGLDYRLESPPELGVQVTSVYAAHANVVLGDYGDNDGVGINATVVVTIPKDLPSGTRHITLTFPNVIRIRDLVGADTPVTPPVIEFTVTNCSSEKERAGSRWWLWLTYGGLCLVGAIVAAIMAEDGGFVVSIVALGGVLFFFGRGIEDLAVINKHAFFIVSGCLLLPTTIALFFISELFEAGLTAALILGGTALVCWWQGWTRVEVGALAILPGIVLGVMAVFMKEQFSTRKR